MLVCVSPSEAVHSVAREILQDDLEPGRVTHHASLSHLFFHEIRIL